MEQHHARIDFLIGVTLIVSALVVGLFLAVRANLDLTNGRYVLFMDERITFDGIQKILYPQNLPAFVVQLLKGDDHRYGRILWNVSSLVSYIPAQIWGDSGQVFATRMTQSVAQLSAFTILTFAFLRSWAFRGLGLWALITLPMTPYYATLPKPEPLQLLFLSIFLALSSRHSFRFGYYWLFLGLAFGSKISVFTLLPVFLLAGFLQQIREPDWVDFPISKQKGSWLRQLFQHGLILLGIYQLLFGLNILISWTHSNFLEMPLLAGGVEPVFASGIPIVVGIGMLFFPTLMNWMQSKAMLTRPSAWFKTAGIFLLGFWIAIPFTILILPAGTKIWLGSTFSNTGHGADDVSVWAWDWIQYILFEWTSIPIPILLAWMLVAVSMITALIIAILSSSKLRLKPSQLIGNHFLKRYQSLVLVTTSAFAFIPIIVLVKRVWGMYLHLSSVLFIVGILAACEFCILGRAFKPASRHVVLGLASIFLLLQVSTTVLYAIPSMTFEMRSYAQRTQDDEFQQKYLEYEYLTNLFDEAADAANRPLKISFDPRLFIPDATEKWSLIEFWGPFNQWHIQPDLIAMYRKVHPLENPPAVTSVSYPEWLAANEAYKKHIVTHPSQTCNTSPCYVERSSEIPELIVFERVTSQ